MAFMGAGSIEGSFNREHDSEWRNLVSEDLLNIGSAGRARLYPSLGLFLLPKGRPRFLRLVIQAGGRPRRRPRP
jgi:hypothetical protein